MKLGNLFAIALAATTSTALADQPLNQDQLQVLINGNTLYVTIPPGAPGAPEGGIAPIYYGEDGHAVAQLPAGPKLTGSWTMADTGYCIDWTNGPKNSCSTLERSEGSFTVKDIATGDIRGQVFTIATGNPENLLRGQE